MKNLIENQLFRKKSHQGQIDQKSSSFSKIQHIASVFSASVSQNKLGSLTPHHLNDQSFTRSNLWFSNEKNKKQSKEASANTLKQKYNLQTVSSLYSEHIYKSFQRDYFHEAQIQKYKMMLNNQKKQKMKLLALQNQWRIQKAKLLQEKQVILFALDSMTVKLDSDINSKKNKQLRRQTAQILKSKFYSSDSSKQNKNQIRFRTDPQSQISNQQRDSSQQQNHQNIFKLNKIRSIKQHFNIKNRFQQKPKAENQCQVQQKIITLEAQYQQTEEKLQKLQVKNAQFQTTIIQKEQKIVQVVQKYQQQHRQKEQLVLKLKKSQEENKNTEIKLQELSVKIQTLTLQKQKVKLKVGQLQKELKLTQEQYKNREERQKQCVKILQRFSQDLKLSDDKINQFLKTQLSSYSQENNNDVSRSKKTYNEHLSYILHLCKKKQSLYQNLVQQFKEKVKQSEFLVSILQKKLSNFTQYQQKLRQLVSNDSDKSTLIKTIVKFGF